MIAFALHEPTTVKLNKFQTRAENHGDALVPAMDMAVSWTTSNRALGLFDPGLRDALCSDLPDGQMVGDQDEMDLSEDGKAFIRFKSLDQPLKWSREFTGYTLTVDYGLGDSSNLKVAQCKLHKFSFELQDGGSVTINFTISSSADINAAFCGVLSLKQQEEITIKLVPPVKSDGQVIDSSAGSGAPGVPNERKADENDRGKTRGTKGATHGGDVAGAVTKAFVEQHGSPAKPH